MQHCNATATAGSIYVFKLTFCDKVAADWKHYYDILKIISFDMGFCWSILTGAHPINLNPFYISTAAQEESGHAKWGVYTPNNRRRPEAPLTSLPKPVKSVKGGRGGGRDKRNKWNENNKVCRKKCEELIPLHTGLGF